MQQVLMPQKEEAKIEFPRQLMNTSYEFVKVLGSGGQGTVCMYRDTVRGQDFAVKLSPDGSIDQSLLNECLLMKELNNSKCEHLP